MSEIRVALLGVGNCASSLVQGLAYYRNAKPADKIPGLMHVDLGGYHLRDIRVVCGFDVDRRKVGRDVSEAIWAPPNNTLKFSDVPRLDAPVHMGEVLDGVAEVMRAQPSDRRFEVADEEPVDVAEKLAEHDVDVLVNYLPVGSEQATAHYMEAALETGVAVVNCIPVFVASDAAWEARFREAGVPVLGDDIKSQVGATIVHRVLTKLFEDRGVKLARTYQLNVGGNTDFLNMQERTRLESKKRSKTEAVQSQLEHRLEADRIHIGPSDYVPWLKDNKVCFLRMEGVSFGDVPLEIELRLSVIDSPNSAGVVVDAIRCAKLAADRHQGGAIVPPSAYFFKHPPLQFPDSEARLLVDRYVAGEAPPKRPPEKVAERRRVARR